MYITHAGIYEFKLFGFYGLRNLRIELFANFSSLIGHLSFSMLTKTWRKYLSRMQIKRRLLQWWKIIKKTDIVGSI